MIHNHEVGGSIPPLATSFIKMNIKDVLRKVLNYLHIDITKNLEYDRLTKAVFKKIILPGNNCIDVGCHKGEILEMMLKYSPTGLHYGFEPIPYLYEKLRISFSSLATILPYALSDAPGKTKFQYVKNAPAYSGLQKRAYKVSQPEIEEIDVEIKTLDELISEDQSIHLIKIDVEGAEYKVLQGASKTIIKNKPYILFEFGLGASDYYEVTPAQLFHLLVEKCNCNIYTLRAFLNNKKPLNLVEFENLYTQNKEYYFIAK